jgi:hypothetical protein
MNKISDRWRQARRDDVSCIMQACIEVCDGDRLVGYAIWFSGGWDGYRRDASTGMGLKCVAQVCPTKEEAIEAVKRG